MNFCGPSTEPCGTPQSTPQPPPQFLQHQSPDPRLRFVLSSQQLLPQLCSTLSHLDQIIIDFQSIPHPQEITSITFINSNEPSIDPRRNSTSTSKLSPPSSKANHIQSPTTPTPSWPLCPKHPGPLMRRHPTHWTPHCTPVPTILFTQKPFHIGPPYTLHLPTLSHNPTPKAPLKQHVPNNTHPSHPEHTPGV